ncbi:MAG: type IV secretion system DNA-binding domain-containing protein [Sphingopyxis sp.]|uniref:type IV secretion system DNA-binding domain-containing protein n=1 Tax=Sphingopyxis sp. TaxID=1908224 RepID=UPI002ABA9252|nr:type IV secretion system DNA-binding domain-containing protein [Sphingopyxis sp.]MDZ3833191.1 type IV secretion system DNA-binding domain-containing protein [Sphingopyxis sp.]
MRDRDQRIHADALRRHWRSNQVRRFKRHAIIFAASIALGGLTLPYLMLTPTTMQVTGTWYVARLKTWISRGTDAEPGVMITQGEERYEASARAVAAHPYYRRSADTVIAFFIRGCLLGFIAWLAGLILLRGAMARRRELMLRDRVIGGTIVTTEKKLAQLTRAEAGDHALAIATVPMPPRLETRHMAMVGTTGSGKTTVLRQILDGVEARGEAALVYDTSGEFVAQYYDPRRGDIILNPFDARCAIWTPFAEIAHPADADRIAQQLITETGQHDRDVWLETSRILVANMIRALWREGKCTLPDLLHALQVRSKDDLKLWLGNSSSARTFADDADRATGSVLFMLAKAANLIQFLRIDEGKETAFSFRDFLSGLDMHPGPKPWIFVPRKEDYFEASKPLLACWLECAASALLGHSPSAERRLWFILDELADLPRVDNLARLLPEGRKFGAAVILTFQAIGQMRHRYGQDLSESMLGCCNTKLFLQMTDSESRQWASDTIGSCEVELPTMTDALADGDYKPRTTLGRQRKVRPAVLESELRLPRHRGYLLFPDGLPVARIALTDDHIVRRGKARQLGYVAGDPTTSLWQQSVEAPPVGTPPVEAEPAVQPSTVPPTEPEPPKPQPSGDGPV